MRRFWIAAHLYLGLSVGLIFAMSGLTGSVLVFYVEIDRLINPALIISVNDQVKNNQQSYQAVLQKLQQTYPNRNKAWRLEIPLEPDTPIMARYYKPQEKQNASFAPLMVAINPYTLEIINQRFWGEYAMTWIYDLHYTLLLDETGKTIMAIIAIFCLISLLTGIYLWWPNHRKWRKSLTIRLRAGYLRKLYDIHTLLGVYALVLLIMLVITGLVLERPEWFKPTIHTLSPTFEKPQLRSNVVNVDKRISVDKALNIAQNRFANAQPRWIETPDSDAGTYLIRLKDGDDISDRFPQTYVWIDQYSGKVRSVRDIKQNSGGDVFMDWQHPLHSGEAFGLVGRWIVFFSGLIPIILLVTGYLRWRRKV